MVIASIAGDDAAVLSAAAAAAAADAAAERRRLEEEVARHEQALAAARRRLDANIAAADADGAGDSDSSVSDDSPDADAVAALHAQALGVLNIRALVPVVLDLNAPYFSQWRRLLLLVLGKYALADHVLTDATFPAIPHWVRMDLHVLSWIYASITTDLFEIITTSAPSAHGAWLALEQQFVGNRETHVLLVDTEFRTLCQGARSPSSITAGA